MSALKKEPAPRRRNLSRMAIRDGAIVRVKVCRRCGVEKVMSQGPESEYYPRKREADGLVHQWQSVCKVCDRFDQAERRAAKDQAERLARRRARHRERMDTDPEYRRKHLASSTAAHQRWLEQPGNLEKARAAARAYKARTMAENPEKLREAKRLWYALKAEREGRELRRCQTHAERAGREAPRVPAGPFNEWLQAYAAARGLVSGEQLAHDLGIPERRVTAVLAGEYERVTLDVVDQALISARTEVKVGGRLVFGLDDLYPTDKAA